MGGTSTNVVTSVQGNLGLTVDIVDGLKFRGIAASSFSLSDNPVHSMSMPFYGINAGGESLVKPHKAISQSTTSSILRRTYRLISIITRPSVNIVLVVYWAYLRSISKHVTSMQCERTYPIASVS